jgi:hypothetical protein
MDKRRKSSGKEEGWDMDQRRRRRMKHGCKEKEKNETWM